MARDFIGFSTHIINSCLACIAAIRSHYAFHPSISTDDFPYHANFDTSSCAAKKIQRGNPPNLGVLYDTINGHPVAHQETQICDIVI